MRSASSALPVELRVAAAECLRLVDGAPAETLVEEGPTIVGPDSTAADGR